MTSIKHNSFLLIFVLIYSFLQVNLRAQKNDANTMDSIEVKAGNLLKINDTIINITSDTIIIIKYGTKYKIKKYSELKSKDFYKNLKEKSEKNRFYYELYNHLIVEDRDTVKENTGDFIKSDEAFVAFKGKVIGNIIFEQLDIFGGSVNDTSLRTSLKVLKSIEKTHINTRESVLRKNLLFKSGQKIEAIVLSDTERKLRSLEYISDAKIIVKPRKNNQEIVDILILTKDNYSIGLGGGFGSFDAWNINIRDRNFIGMGYGLSYTLFYDNSNNPNYGHNASFVIDNIASSFIRGEINYLNTATVTYKFIDFSREFVSVKTKYGGGLRIGQIEDKWNYHYQDSTYDIPFVRNFGDLWIGRAVNVNKKDKSKSIVISGRYFTQKYTSRDIVNIDTNQFLHNKQLILASLSYRNINYFKTSMLLGYGVVEDVPKGLLLQLTSGVELAEFKKRNYLAFRAAGAFILKSKGFFAISVNAGSFFRNYIAEESLAKINLRYFTRLFKLGSYKFRQIIEFGYTGGFNQLYYENFSFSDEIFGLSSDSPRGVKKISLKLQTVSFLPINLLRFKFTAYSFIHGGFISQNSDIYKAKNFFSTIGLGLRVTNKNMVFGTLNISFSFYPRVNNDASQYYFNFETSESKLFREITVEKPDVLKF